MRCLCLRAYVCIVIGACVCVCVIERERGSSRRSLKPVVTSSHHATLYQIHGNAPVG